MGTYAPPGCCANCASIVALIYIRFSLAIGLVHHISRNDSVTYLQAVPINNNIRMSYKLGTNKNAFASPSSIFQSYYYLLQVQVLHIHCEWVSAATCTRDAVSINVGKRAENRWRNEKGVEETRILLFFVATF